MRDENRYEIENLPISQKTFDGLSHDGINLLGAIGRMLKIQDLDADQKFDEILLGLATLNTKIDRLTKKVNCLEKTVKGHTIKIERLEKRIEAIEKVVA